MRVRFNQRKMVWGLVGRCFHVTRPTLQKSEGGAPYAYFWIVAITNIDAVARDLMFGFVVAVGQIQNDGFTIAFFAVIFVEDGLGDYILFAGPISEVALAASFAAKGKIRMNSRVGRGLTYRAFVFHIVLPGL